MEVQPPPSSILFLRPPLSSRGAVLGRIRSKAESYIQGSEGRAGASPSQSSSRVSVHDQDLGLSSPIPALPEL